MKLKDYKLKIKDNKDIFFRVIGNSRLEAIVDDKGFFLKYMRLSKATNDWKTHASLYMNKGDAFPFAKRVIERITGQTILEFAKDLLEVNGYVVKEKETATVMESE